MAAPYAGSMTSPSFGPEPADAPPLRWGILAPGGVARTFARDVPAHTQSRIVAVGSRSPERAQAFASEFDIPTAHGSYADLVADPQVEAIYIASPHSEHRDHARLALEAGKPVLVEKSITRNAAEAREIFDLARERRLFVMEAMWTRFLPHMVALREVLASGEIGDVVTLTAEHGQALDLPPEHRLKNPELAGGALLDLGVYPVSFAHDMLGVPDAITAVGTYTETGVDGNEAIVLRYGTRTLALLSSTLWSATPNGAVISGTKGRIEVAPTLYAPSSFTVRLLEGEPRTVTVEVSGGFQYEAAEVARRIHAGELESSLHTWEDTLAVMSTMDQVRAQLGVLYPGE